MIFASGIHDPAVFVCYTGDTPSYAKIVFSVAEQDALLTALLEHWRRNGRDVVIHERAKEVGEDG